MGQTPRAWDHTEQIVNEIVVQLPSPQPTVLLQMVPQERPKAPQPEYAMQGVNQVRPMLFLNAQVNDHLILLVT